MLEDNNSSLNARTHTFLYWRVQRCIIVKCTRPYIFVIKGATLHTTEMYAPIHFVWKNRYQITFSRFLSTGRLR